MWMWMCECVDVWKMEARLTNGPTPSVNCPKLTTFDQSAPHGNHGQLADSSKPPTVLESKTLDIYSYRRACCTLPGRLSAYSGSPSQMVRLIGRAGQIGGGAACIVHTSERRDSVVTRYYRNTTRHKAKLNQQDWLVKLLHDIGPPPAPNAPIDALPLLLEELPLNHQPRRSR